MKKILFVLLIILLASCSNRKTIFVYYATIMEPTIDRGDYIELDTSIKEFNYGDIVMVDHYIENYPDKMTDYFRIVGMPKDSISIQDGICIINGIKCKASFIRNGLATQEFEEELPNGIKIRISVQPEPRKGLDQSTIYIPPNHYYMLGDFRASNPDSRVFGAITSSQIVGKVVKIEKAKRKLKSWE